MLKRATITETNVWEIDFPSIMSDEEIEDKVRDWYDSGDFQGESHNYISETGGVEIEILEVKD